MARSRWKSLGAIARCLGREELVDELAFEGGGLRFVEIDVSVRKRVLETHGPKTNHPKVSQNSRTRQKNPFKEPWHIVLSALCSPSNLFRDLGFRSGSIFCTVLRHGFPLGSPPLSSSLRSRRRLIAQLKLRYRYRNLLSAICGLSPLTNGAAPSPEYSSPKSSKYRWAPKNENTSSFKSAWSAALTSGGIGNGSSNFSAITRSTFVSIALYSGSRPSPALADPPSRLPTHHAEARTASGSLARGAQQRWNALRH